MNYKIGTDTKDVQIRKDAPEWVYVIFLVLTIGIVIGQVIYDYQRSDSVLQVTYAAQQAHKGGEK